MKQLEDFRCKFVTYTPYCMQERNTFMVNIANIGQICTSQKNALEKLILQKNEIEQKINVYNGDRVQERRGKWEITIWQLTSVLPAEDTF